jgi:hypothetical protein
VRQLTIRLDDQAERAVRRLARSEGMSLSAAVLRLVRKSVGLGAPAEQADVVGDSLDDLIGAWSRADERVFLAATAAFEKVDESLWR